MQHSYFKNYSLTYLTCCITFAHLDSQSKGPGCCCFWKVLGSWGWGICSVIEAYLLCARLDPVSKMGEKCLKATGFSSTGPRWHHHVADSFNDRKIFSPQQGNSDTLVPGMF